MVVKYNPLYTDGYAVKIVVSHKATNVVVSLAY